MSGSRIDTGLSHEPVTLNSWTCNGTARERLSFEIEEEMSLKLLGSCCIERGCGRVTPFQRKVEPKDKESPSLGDISSVGQAPLLFTDACEFSFQLKAI